VHGSLADASEANTHIELAETKDTEDVLPRPAIEEAKVFEASSASSEPPAQQMCSVHRNLASAMLAKQQLQQLPRSSVSSKKQKKQQRKQQLQEEADSSNATPQRGDCVSHQLIEATVRNVQRDNDQKAMEAKCREATALQECMRSGEAAKKSRRKPQLMTIPGNRPVGFSADSGTGEAQQQEEHQDSKNLLLGREDDAKKFRFKPQLMTIPGNRAVGSMENSGEKDDPSGKSSGILQAQLAWSPQHYRTAVWSRKSQRRCTARGRCSTSPISQSLVMEMLVLSLNVLAARAQGSRGKERVLGSPSHCPALQSLALRRSEILCRASHSWLKSLVSMRVVHSSDRY